MSPSPSTETAENLDSPPTPSPILAPPAPSTSRLFAPIPSSSRTPEDSSTPSPSPTDGPDGPSSSTERPADPLSGPASPSDTPSTGKGLKLSKAGLRAGIGTLFRQTTRLFAAVVAIEAEREYGVWEPDPDDIDDVAHPTTNLIYRRLPDDAKGGDLIDLLALALAIGAYMQKNLQRRAVVRTHLRMQAEQGIDVTGGEQQG